MVLRNDYRIILSRLNFNIIIEFNSSLMKTRILIIIAVLYAIFFSACSNSNKSKADFTEESFRNTINLTDYVIYQNDSMVNKLADPRWIRYHPDSFLIVLDMRTPKMIKIIDLTNNRIQELIPKGKGPGEMIAAWGVQIFQKEVYVCCSQLNKIIILSSDSLRNFRIREEFTIKESIGSFFPLNDELIVSLSAIGDKHPLSFFNHKGELVKKIGNYPNLVNSTITGDNDIFNSLITAAPDGIRFVLAYGKTDLIDIYDSEKGLQKRFQGPLGIELSAYKENVGSFSITSTEPAVLTYSMVDANNDEFWASYIGFKQKKGYRPSMSELFPKLIFCFNWNGDPLRILELNLPVLCFDVDWQGKVLYAIAWQKESAAIVYYKMNNIL